MRGLEGDNTGLRRRSAHGDGEIGAESERRMRAAIAADSPPLEPPGVRSRSQGLFDLPVRIPPMNAPLVWRILMTNGLSKRRVTIEIVGATSLP